MHGAAGHLIQDPHNLKFATPIVKIWLEGHRIDGWVYCVDYFPYNLIWLSACPENIIDRLTSFWSASSSEEFWTGDGSISMSLGEGARVPQ